MRIRKNAKVSPLLFTCSSSLLQNGSFPFQSFQTHMCQLNQSPWDIIPFHSNTTSIQFQHQEPSFKNGDSFGAVGESVVSMMETEDGDDNKQQRGNNEVVSNGGDKGLKRNSNVGGGNGDIVGARRGRGRPRKVGSVSGSGSSLNNNNNNNSKNNNNNNEFYYYSGFGPWWGKRRGDNRNNEGEDSKIGSDNVKVNNVGGYVNVVPSLDMDYVEDYEEDYDDYCDNNGKRRMRKPVKERSLKSLM